MVHQPSYGHAVSERVLNALLRLIVIAHIPTPTCNLVHVGVMPTGGGVPMVHQDPTQVVVGTPAVREGSLGAEPGHVQLHGVVYSCSVLLFSQASPVHLHTKSGLECNKRHAALYTQSARNISANYDHVWGHVSP